tara:strand:- start:5050 stop:6228 length:1179 start_codon:yes stop_codon:yes gene_type:complete
MGWPRKIDLIYDDIYASLDDDRRVFVDLVRSCETDAEAAKKLGVHSANIGRRLARILQAASDKGHVEGHPYMPIAEGKKLGKMTTHLKDGKVTNVWYRQNDQYDELMKALEDTANILDFKPPVVKRVGPLVKDVLSCYNIGDMHIGMMAWHEETGTDFDLQIVVGDLLKAMADLISRTLPSETCIILNLGDAIHFHDDSQTTKQNKNSLDGDGRIDKVFRITCALMNKLVEMALAKHKYVVVRNVKGNHDEELAMAIRHQMNAYWRSEKRVSIEMSPAETWFYEFGKVMLMATHGHMLKPDKMVPYMSSRMPEMWGRCKLRRALHGHFHSKSVIESLGGKAECFSNLAPNDAWHEAVGYRSELECVAVMYHKCGKEIGRQNYMLHHDEVGEN